MGSKRLPVSIELLSDEPYVTAAKKLVWFDRFVRFIAGPRETVIVDRKSMNVFKTLYMIGDWFSGLSLLPVCNLPPRGKLGSKVRVRQPASREIFNEKNDVKGC